MSYEDCPATKMLAVYCACCARPLVDAVSVETGVGPECRKKHGFTEAQSDPDWDAFRAAIDVPAAAGVEATLGVPFAVLASKVDAMDAAWRLGGLETRALANKFTHRIAVEQNGDTVLALTNAVRALGYAKLAERISKRVARVLIIADKGDYLVKTPYCEEGLDAMRGLPRGERLWDKPAKMWRVRPSAKRALFERLTAAFPGVVASGPKGLFTLAAA